MLYLLSLALKYVILRVRMTTDKILNMWRSEDELTYSYQQVKNINPIDLQTEF